MHKPVTADSDVIFDSINKAAPERVLYFIADVPHLIKTIRNCFASSSEKRYYNRQTGRNMLRRRLEKNGEKILWSTIVELYKHQSGKTLRLSHQLNAQNVFINGYSKMKVKYAAQVLSRTVAHHLEEWKGESKRERVDFIRRVNDFFDMLNGAHSEQAGRTLNLNLQAYYSPNDQRFQKLEDFVAYLDDWKKEAEALDKNNTSKNISLQDIGHSFDFEEDEDEPEEEDPASVRQLSRQTLEGIKMTVCAFTKAVKFLLGEGTKFINARIFCQDPLEQFFSKQRARGGGSTTPNFCQFINESRGMGQLGEMGAKRNFSGNTEELEKSMEISSEPLPKRKSLGRSVMTRK
ncbi:Transposable element P transposase [Frankliniella fusca]|uniref:Transposable element P transposase n=1 Tax=Frankliniella fusca TaxID=407009 RepID=A0AAE1I506_9NEOP|nr:Transposable element P transposase [Frankliniella fusca]